MGFSDTMFQFADAIMDSLTQASNERIMVTLVVGAAYVAMYLVLCLSGNRR